MVDDKDNDVDAGWDDIDAGWDVEASGPKPKPPTQRITAESEPLPALIPIPSLEPEAEVEQEEKPAPEFTEDDVTANRLYDAEVLAGDKSDAVVTIEPFDEDVDAHQEVTRDRTAELMGGSLALGSKDTVKRISAITEETEPVKVAQTEEEQRRDDPTSPSLETAASTEPAPTPAQEPSGKAFEVPSPLKAAGSGPAAAPKLQVSKPEGANLSLIVFILLVVLALGAVGAVILAAFF